MARLEEFVTSPITALFVAVVFGALALSGRFNVTLTQAFLRIAWLVAVFGLRSQPYPLWIGGSAIVGGVLLILAFYFTPQAVFQNIGFLQSTKTTLFSAESNTVRRMVQFGPNGPTIGSSAADYRLDPGAPFLPYLKESHLTVEWIDGQIKVSTDIRDKSGNLIVRLIRNEWQVAPPRMFDRNYSQNALEVLGPNGVCAPDKNFIGPNTNSGGMVGPRRTRNPHSWHGQ